MHDILLAVRAGKDDDRGVHRSGASPLTVIDTSAEPNRSRRRRLGAPPGRCLSCVAGCARPWAAARSCDSHELEADVGRGSGGRCSSCRSRRFQALDFASLDSTIPSAPRRVAGSRLHRPTHKGRLTFYNRGGGPVVAAAEPELRHRPLVRQSAALLPPMALRCASSECPMAIAVKEDRPVCGVEAVIERPDGTRVHFLSCPTPLHDPSGALDRRASTCWSTSASAKKPRQCTPAAHRNPRAAHRGAHARDDGRPSTRLQASEQRFRLLVQGVTDYAIYMLDVDGHVAQLEHYATSKSRAIPADELSGATSPSFYTERIEAPRAFRAWSLGHREAKGALGAQKKTGAQGRHAVLGPKRRDRRDSRRRQPQAHRLRQGDPGYHRTPRGGGRASEAATGDA